MPTFCRHGRFESSCGICRQEQAKAEPKSVIPTRKGTAARRPASSAKPAASAGSSRPARSRTVVTGKLQRNQDDGFRSDLVPGLRSRADAEQLAREVLLAEARLSLHGKPEAGPWAPLADLMGEPEHAFVLALATALSSPDSSSGSLATAAAAQAAVQGVSAGDLPATDALAEAIAAGPRGPRAHDAAVAALAVPAQLAQRAGGSLGAALQGEGSWTPQRRFARLMDRLALRGLPRAARYDVLVALGRSGALDVRADALHLGSDQVTDAAKRVFAVADVALLERRAVALAEALGAELDALELALWNLAGVDATGAGAAARWSTAQPATDLGLVAEIDDDEAVALAELLGD